MRPLILLAVFALAGCGTNRCITGQSSACACVDGKMGAQTCQADGTFGACQCGALACNSTNCASGCCDATGACSAGTAITACGTGAAACIACGVGQTCTDGSCTASNVGGGNGSTGGGGGASVCAGGGSPCAGCCMGSVCIQSQGACGINGAECQTCTAQQFCSSTGTCVTPKRIFATATLYNGNLGGLIGADQKCRTAAQAASLGGSWVSWISDLGNDALDGVPDVGPWYVKDSNGFSIAFNNLANFQTTPRTSVNRNELGGNNSAELWTGTATGGLKTTFTCSSWTSSASGTTGTVGTGVGQSWTASYDAPCNTMKSVLCIER